MNNKKIEEIIKEFNKELCCSFDVEDENGIKTGEKTFALKNIANQKPIIDFITKKLTQVHNSAIEGCEEETFEVLEIAKKKLYPYQDDSERLQIIVEKLENLKIK